MTDTAKAPDLDDTVDDLIAKGFSRVKAIKLFYENQKLKKTLESEQHLFHNEVPNMNGRGASMAIATDQPPPPSDDPLLTYSPSPRPGDRKKSFEFDDVPSPSPGIVQAALTSPPRPRIESTASDDASERRLSTGSTGKPPVRPPRKIATDPSLDALFEKDTNFDDLGLNTQSISYDSDDTRSSDGSRSHAPPVQMPELWTEEDERQVQLIMGTGLIRRRALRKYLKLKQQGAYDAVIQAAPVRVTELDEEGEREVDRLIDEGVPPSVALKEVLDRATAKQAAEMAKQIAEQHHHNYHSPTGGGSDVRAASPKSSPGQQHHAISPNPSQQSQQQHQYRAFPSQQAPSSVAHQHQRHMHSGAAEHNVSNFSSSTISNADNYNSSFYSTGTDESPQGGQQTVQGVGWSHRPQRMASTDSFGSALPHPSMMPQHQSQSQQRVGSNSKAARALQRMPTTETMDSWVSDDDIEIRAPVSQKRVGAIGVGNPNRVMPSLAEGHEDAAFVGGEAAGDVISEEQQEFRAALLAEQMSIYGVDMMQSLTELDDPIIDQYVADGFSVDVAILNVFQQKIEGGIIRPLRGNVVDGSRQPFGGGEEERYYEHHQQDDRYSDVAAGPDPRFHGARGASMPLHDQYYNNPPHQQHHGGYVPSGNSSEVGSRVGSNVGDEELEIELIMSRGYTRAEAIRMFLARKKQEGGGGGGGGGGSQVGYGGSQVSTGSSNTFSPNRPTPTSGGSGQHFFPPDGASSLQPAAGHRRMSSSRRMGYRWQERDEEELAMLVERGYSKEAALEIIGQRINNEIATGGSSGEMAAPLAPMHSPSPRGGPVRQSSTRSYDSRASQPQYTPPPQPQYTPPPQQQYTPPPPPQQQQQSYVSPPPSGRRSINGGMNRQYSGTSTGSSANSGNARRNMGGKSVSQEDLETALLLSEQESKYNTNMFEAMRPGDEQLISSMSADGSMSRNQAIKILFDSRFGNEPQQRANHGEYTGRRASAGQANSRAAPAPAAAPKKPPEEDEFEKALRLSALESDNFRPGVQRVEGFASRSGNSAPRPAPPPPARRPSGQPSTASETDIQSLCSMGFPRGSAIDALDRCNNDIGAAAEYLLGNG